MTSSTKEAVAHAGHIPVLKREVLTYLKPEKGEDAIDATLGGGGHASAILEATGPGGRLLGIEWDARTLEETRKRLESFGSRAMLVHGNYRDLGMLARTYAFPAVSMILFDLGYSSFQIDDAERGFSFRNNGPLDMRYDADHATTAADIVNTWPKKEIIRILREYGEERSAGRIATAIVEARDIDPILTTKALARLVRDTARRSGKIHPATQTFQALRIAVNDEFGNLKEALPIATSLLERGGRIGVISFHSLEDRIVKNFFRETEDLKPITKRPISPAQDEIDGNSRSRSAKLRVAVKN